MKLYWGFGVAVVHLCLMIALWIYGTVTPSLSPTKKFLVETVVLNPERSNLSAQIINAAPKVNVKPSLPPKVLPKAAPKPQANPEAKKSPSTPSQNAKLLAAKESLAKIHAIKNEVSFLKENAFKQVKNEPVGQTGHQSEEISHFQAISLILRQKLRLPESGDVKVEIMIDSLGKIIRVRTIEAQNTTNQLYLEQKLPEIILPPFKRKLNLENPYTFILTFTHDA